MRVSSGTGNSGALPSVVFPAVIACIEQRGAAGRCGEQGNGDHTRSGIRWFPLRTPPHSVILHLLKRIVLLFPAGGLLRLLVLIRRLGWVGLRWVELSWLSWVGLSWVGSGRILVGGHGLGKGRGVRGELIAQLPFHTIPHILSLYLCMAPKRSAFT